MADGSDLQATTAAEMSTAMLHEEEQLHRQLSRAAEKETADRIKHLAAQRQDLEKNGDTKYEALMKLVSASKVCTIWGDGLSISPSMLNFCHRRFPVSCFSNYLKRPR
jgi:hypothetical protein